ncbi:penicillin-binding protein 2 [Lederbergia panacisoli]|uniref:peptidoglycan D,D-transpeptidase FtsI family protein n=1 Tax=Lederbergia panacisoli TaxID=1255251 RepID=UPI00214B613E|nr:penicillin-binding protein 2 [Lederbergia panacisoli]MCR2820400.1 penicillin-binding protein 2 [Lederbergia panacisoli]
MNMLFFVVFVMFSMLILRLGYVQIVSGEDAKREIDRTEDVTVKTSVPRGLIYDRNFNPVVDNEPQKAITYTAPKQFDSEKTLETARTLAKIIHQDTDKITHRDMVDFWLLLNPEEANAKVSKEEIKKYKGKESELYKLQRERVTDEELGTLTDEDLEVLAIYREFTGGYALDPQFVKNKDVSLKEYAEVNEHLGILPGVDTTTDWERVYLYGDTLRSILGNVTPGLPVEKLDYYESRGYSRNDRVGKSYIELQYEDVLRGQKEKVKNVTKSGEVLETVPIHEGERGKDLVLTIDMDLQKAIDKILEEEILKTKGKSSTQLLDRAFVTMMDPYTGEILALSGKQYSYDEEEGKYTFKDFASGNFTTAYEPGSAVKGASVLTGYMSGVIGQGSQLKDEVIKLADTPAKKSWDYYKGARWLTDEQALIQSSNAYMFKLAMLMGGMTYTHPEQKLSINKYEVINDQRNYFSQFGLGVRTGLDLPGEQTGFKGDISAPDAAGKTLDFMIGQFDTFTPLQLAQYVSTIVNGGYRMQAHIVKEIRDPIDENGNFGPIVQEIKPKVLNRINASDSEIARVRRAFWGVFHSPSGTGTAFNAPDFRPYNAAGKTGTAEAFDQGKGVWNVSLVAYAPYENPEIAFSILVPSAYLKGGTQNNINIDIGTRVLKAYFDLKEKRAKQDTSEEENNEEENVEE